jgi:hypothetical protein
MELIRLEIVHWIQLVQERNRSWGFVKIIMKFGVHKVRGIFRVDKLLLTSQKGRCSMESFRRADTPRSEMFGCERLECIIIVERSSKI